MPSSPRKVKARKAKSIKEVLANLQISDVYLWSTDFARLMEYMPSLHDGMTSVQSYLAVELQEGDVTFAGDSVAKPLLRALVTFGVRSVLDSEKEEVSEVEEEGLEVLHSLTATFAIDLFVVDSDLVPTEELLMEFVERNLPLLAWPFWRNHVYDTFKRASLPVPVVPLYGSVEHHELSDA